VVYGRRAMALNTRHPRYFWYPLVHDAYRQKDYPRAAEHVLEGLRKAGLNV